jgi:hypothetical protein
MDLDTSVGKLVCVLGEAGEPSFVTQHTRDLRDDARRDNGRNRVVSEPQKIPFFLQDGFDEFGARRPSEDDDTYDMPPTGKQETANTLTEEETAAAIHARKAMDWLEEELSPTVPPKTCKICNKSIKNNELCTECVKKGDQPIDAGKVLSDLSELRQMALYGHKPSAKALKFHLLGKYGMFPTGAKVRLNTETFNGVEGHVADADLSKIGPGRVPVKILGGRMGQRTYGVKLIMFDKLALL